MTDAIEPAFAALRAGQFVIVTDDVDREDEGDLILAAEFATPERIAFLLQHTSGIICVALLPERLAQLNLPMMVEQNTARHGTPFTVSVDAAHGITTGVSAADRAKTLAVLLDAKSTPADLARPGHVFPLQANPAGVLKRAGHTEAALDLARLAGLHPAGVLCELMNADGTMMRGTTLRAFATQHRMPLLSIAELIAYRRAHRCIRTSTAKLPTRFGEFQMHAYEDAEGKTHLALVRESVAGAAPLVRVHSECLTGDNLFSIRCDCGQQLAAAMEQIGREGGVLLYLRQEGRGIGLANKLRAYAVQDTGFDTVEANEQLNLPIDARDYGLAAEMLKDLGITHIRLLTNNPEKVSGLQQHGIAVERVPLQAETADATKSYLEIKKRKMGHLLEVE